MTPEEKKLLQETAELARDNNKILHAMRRSNRWSMVFRIMYWVLILGGLAAGYYYVQPYLNQAIKLYSQVQSQIGQLGNLGQFGR
ncbi:MAG: hypothetical protein WC764_01030 [Candidatus Paceibacterota bacterium]|jgi:hypothetical protein